MNNDFILGERGVKKARLLCSWLLIDGGQGLKPVVDDERPAKVPLGLLGNKLIESARRLITYLIYEYEHHLLTVRTHSCDHVFSEAACSVPAGWV